MKMERVSKWHKYAGLSLEGHLEVGPLYGETGGQALWNPENPTTIEMSAYLLGGSVPGIETPSWISGGGVNVGYLQGYMKSVKVNINTLNTSGDPSSVFGLVVGDIGVKGALGLFAGEIDGAFELVFPTKNSRNNCVDVDVIAYVQAAGSLQLPVEVGKFLIRIGARGAGSLRVKGLMRARHTLIL